MAKILFGTNQINKPTPAYVNRAVRIFTVATGIFVAWMATTNIMGPHTKDIVNQILGLLVTLANGLAPMVGVEVSGDIPAKDVTAVETK